MTRCFSERPHRSIFQTNTASNFRLWASDISLFRAGRESFEPEMPLSMYSSTSADPDAGHTRGVRATASLDPGCRSRWKREHRSLIVSWASLSAWRDLHRAGGSSYLPHCAWYQSLLFASDSLSIPIETTGRLAGELTAFAAYSGLGTGLICVMVCGGADTSIFSFHCSAFSMPNSLVASCSA